MDSFNEPITKYANEVNNIAFSNFSERELNMLFALMTNMRDKGIERAIFSYSEMKEKMGLGNTHITKAEFREAMEQMREKLNKVTCRIETEKSLIAFVLFPTFTMDDEEKKITIAVNPDFAFVLNCLTEYTKFQLEEFIGVDGKYAKLLYTHLRQWRTTGRYCVKLADLRRLLDVPTSYSAGEIKKEIINPCVEKLRKVKEFKDLKCNPRYLSKRGGTVSGYEFIWKASSKETEKKPAGNLPTAEADASAGKPAVSIEDVIAMSIEDVIEEEELEEACEEDELMRHIFYGD